VIVEIFQISGNIPDSKILLKSLTNGNIKLCAPYKSLFGGK